MTNEAAETHSNPIDYSPFLLLKSYTYFLEHVQTVLKHMQKKHIPCLLPEVILVARQAHALPPTAVYRMD